MRSEHNAEGNPNQGHGHVFPRPDGVRARCGGPRICAACARDLAEALEQRPPEPQPLGVPMIVAPADTELTEAEVLGLAVANAAQSLVESREGAIRWAVVLEARLEAALEALRELVKEWPQTSWAHDALPLENAKAVLAGLDDPADLAGEPDDARRADIQVSFQQAATMAADDTERTERGTTGQD